MSEYLRVRRKANLQDGDLLETTVEEDGSVRLVLQTPVGGKLAEQFQL